MKYSNEMSREIIFDHLENPRNKKENSHYQQKQLKNPACGDIVTVFLDLEHNQIKDLTYQVSGCSLCAASASIMSEKLKNKTVKEAKDFTDNLVNMLTDQPYDQKILNEALCFEGIKDIAPRIKCVTLPYKALMAMVGVANEKL